MILTAEMNAHFDTIMAAVRPGDDRTRKALRAVWLELAGVDMKVMMAHRDGYNKALDTLGAPDKGAAPVERMLKLQRLLAIDAGLK